MSTMDSAPATRPPADEYAPFYAGYISLVPDGDVLGLLEEQRRDTLALLAELPEERGGHRYGPGKWSLKEVLGHVIDGERVFSYRALHFARGDRSPLPGMDQDPYVEAGRFGERSLADLIAEYDLVRRSTLALLRPLDAQAWGRRGVASGAEVTVRALAYIIAGHERHHLKILRERYL
jgi:hypothetical protein